MYWGFAKLNIRVAVILSPKSYLGMATKLSSLVFLGKSKKVSYSTQDLETIHKWMVNKELLGM